jgi:hypothetical protein
MQVVSFAAKVSPLIEENRKVKQRRLRQNRDGSEPIPVLLCRAKGSAPMLRFVHVYGLERPSDENRRWIAVANAHEAPA